MKVINVGIAELDVACAPDRIRTTGLGSCVGVVIYDRLNKVAGLAHVMLPSKTLSRGSLNVAKYADTAIPVLLEKMTACGAKQAAMEAKLVGGAQMFKLSSRSQLLRIGERNVEACRAELARLDIPIVAEETGGSIGRTIELDTLSGVLYVRTAKREVKQL